MAFKTKCVGSVYFDS